MGDDQYVSTGVAAKLLGVTPDTVLKWIKRGRLDARRTAGGHYRIARASLAWMRGEQEEASAASSPVVESKPVYCWEYHASGGVVRAECEQCKAYQAKALRCYELRCLPSGMGSPNDFCATTCEVCGYYREQVHGPIRVLVVSDSVSLRDELQRRAANRPVRFEFAAREYECASIVEAFHPEFALLDCSLPRSTWTSVASCMSGDPRAAGIRIVLLSSRRSNRASGGELPPGATAHARIAAPLSWAELEDVIGLRPISPPETEGTRPLKPPRKRRAKAA